MRIEADVHHKCIFGSHAPAYAGPGSGPMDLSYLEPPVLP